MGDLELVEVRDWLFEMDPYGIWYLVVLLAIVGTIIWWTRPAKGTRPIKTKPAGTLFESLIRPLRLRGRSYRAAYWRTVAVASLGLLGAALPFAYLEDILEHTAGDAMNVIRSF